MYLDRTITFVRDPDANTLSAVIERYPTMVDDDCARQLFAGVLRRVDHGEEVVGGNGEE